MMKGNLFSFLWWLECTKGLKSNDGAALVVQMVKNLPAMQETQVWSLGWEDPLEEGMQPSPVFLPGESHGQRNLVGYSPWGCKESDTTEQLMLKCMKGYFAGLFCTDIQLHDKVYCIYNIYHRLDYFRIQLWEREQSVWHFISRGQNLWKWGEGNRIGQKEKYDCTMVYHVLCSCYYLAKLCPTVLRPHGLQPTRIFISWDFLATNSGVGCHPPDPRIKPRFLQCKWIHYCSATREALAQLNSSMDPQYYLKLKERVRLWYLPPPGQSLGVRLL